MSTPQDRRAYHRAAIRNTILTAAHDMNNMRWETQDDALLDIIDDWLGKLETEMTAFENFKSVISEESEGNSASNAPKHEIEDDPIPRFLRRLPVAETLPSLTS